MQSARFNRASNNAIRWSIFATSLCAIFTLLLRQHYKSKWFTMFKDARLRTDF